MEAIKQLKVELSLAHKRKSFVENELRKLGECIEILEKEVAYRTILE